MKNYYRIIAGRKSAYADVCHAEQFICADYNIDTDLAGKLPDNWRDFNKEFIPVYLKKKPYKTKIAAGLACGILWIISKGIQKGDIILCPDETGAYLAGEVSGDYFYHSGEILPHRRSVNWFPKRIERNSMTLELQHSTGSIGTVSNISKYAEEVESLLSGNRPPTLISTDDTV